MNRIALLSILALCFFFAPDALAGVAASTTEAANQAVYYKKLLDIFTNLLITIAFLISIIGLLMVGSFYAIQTFDKDAMSKRDFKPMSFLSFLGGIMLVSLLASPLKSMEFFNDITGLNKNSGLTMCSVVEVKSSFNQLPKSGDACITAVEEKLKKLAGYTKSEHLKAANFGLLFGVIQMLSIFFFLVAGVSLLKHILGFRQIKITVAQSIIAMMVASAVYALPNIVDYIEDLRGGSTRIIDTQGNP